MTQTQAQHLLLHVLSQEPGDHLAWLALADALEDAGEGERAVLGWRVLWVTTGMVLDGQALDVIRRALA